MNFINLKINFRIIHHTNFIKFIFIYAIYAIYVVIKLYFINFPISSKKHLYFILYQ